MTSKSGVLWFEPAWNTESGAYGQPYEDSGWSRSLLGKSQTHGDHAESIFGEPPDLVKRASQLLQKPASVGEDADWCQLIVSFGLGAALLAEDFLHSEPLTTAPESFDTDFFWLFGR